MQDPDPIEQISWRFKLKMKINYIFKNLYMFNSYEQVSSLIWLQMLQINTKTISNEKMRKIQSHKGRHGLYLSRDSSQPHGYSDEEQKQNLGSPTYYKISQHCPNPIGPRRFLQPPLVLCSLLQPILESQVSSTDNWFSFTHGCHVRKLVEK